MTQPTFNTYGAVDLGALAARSQQRSAPATPPVPVDATAAPGGAFVVDVTEADFNDVVITTSMTVPVVLDFWASWCGPCRALSPILERLAARAGGAWLLAKIDSDAEQRLAAAFQVQSIPSVFAVVKGQPVPLFQGALPEAQVRQYIEEVLRIAAANGVSGRLDAPPAAGATPVEEPPAGETVVEEPQGDPRFDPAYDAAERGDYEAAAAAFRAVLSESPNDPEAISGVAQVELLGRVQGLADPESAVSAADGAPADLPAQLAAADVEFATGAVDAAFERLLRAVRETSGADREAARARLLDFFLLLGPDDERVPTTRRALARALF